VADEWKRVSHPRVDQFVTNLLTPFLIGLAGSLHCMGMCAPLVVAASRSGKNAITRNLHYNLGRILTYGMLGSIASFIGAGFYLAGLQQWVSVIAGLSMLAIGILSIRIATPAYVQGFLFRFSNALKSKFQKLLNKRNLFATLLMGMINGLLPCGMTLVAIGYCLTLPGPTNGFLSMVLFGLGTLPAMVGFASITRFIVNRLRINYSTLQAGLIIVCAIMLIARGVWPPVTSAIQPGKNAGIVICGTPPAF
jgi:sulfite exporter TauE/SafE